MLLTMILSGAIALFILDTLRLRRRVSLWQRVPDVGAPDSLKTRMVVGPGVSLPKEARQRAERWMEVEGIESLDLIPMNLDGLQALALAMFYDPEHYRSAPFERGRSALHCLLAREDVAERAGIQGGTAANSAVVARAAHHGKRFAPRGADLALIEGLEARPEALAWRRQVMTEAFGGNTRLLFYVAPVLYLLLLSALWLPMGWLLVAVYHLQPFLIFGGQGIRVQHLPRITALRLPLECWNWWVAFRTMRQGKNTRAERAESLRAEYEVLLERDPEEFFQKRKKKCVLCRQESLVPLLSTGDLYQGKPGKFQLDECTSCGHIFQNPPLNPDGLSFYYKDFYDGLGEDMLESIFDSGGNPYDARGALVRKYGGDAPANWLDVGAGHGHLCAYLQGTFPQTRFHALDIGDSIQEALSRTWVHAIHEGFFPDLASRLTEQFQVVSMSHYLEHTMEPKREIQSAFEVLQDDGVLLIELPDPESKLGRILKRYWLPWFQPQHQHLYSVPNLTKVLQEEGFRVEEVERGSAHQAVDFSSAWILFLNQHFPDRTMPWIPRGTKTYDTVRSVVWSFGFLPLIVLKTVDLCLSPLFSRPGWSNTFRLLARKKGKSVG